jgi:hypothetical protein
MVTKKSKEIEERQNFLLRYHTPQSVTAELMEKHRTRASNYFGDHYYTLYEVYTTENYAKKIASQLKKDYKFIPLVKSVMGTIKDKEYAVYVR